MESFTILGTDTDAGKTTLSLLLLAAFPGRWSYWKPLETGDSDSDTVRRLLPDAVVHPPIARFRDPVAPPLAARREGRIIPNSAAVADGLPRNGSLLVETFGSPFSPLNETELQIELIKRLALPTILVGSSKLGAIGRVLAMLKALAEHQLKPHAVVLLGETDDYAVEQIEHHGARGVFSLNPPTTWDSEGIREAAHAQRTIISQFVDDNKTSGEHKGSDLQPAPVRSQLVDDLLTRDQRHVWHPYTSLRHPDPPLPVVGAKAEFLELADGRRLIDGISSWWTILHGHREPRLMAALTEAMQSFDHVLFAGVTHPPAVRVAELLLQTVPWTGGRVFFSDNGSTAVEVSLKMAYQYWCHRGEPQRKFFIGFEDGYHGDTFGAMAVGRDPLFFGRFEPLLFQAERIPVSAERLDELLKQRAHEVAAIIIEPLVQGAGGMRMHTPDELHSIGEVAKRHGILFIADEVMTGCFRTGTMWAHQAADVAPDLICTSKTLAGGILPLAATLVAPHVVTAFDTADRERTFFHGHSFTAHPLACAVAAANLEWLQREPPTAPARVERFWSEQLLPLRDQPSVRDVRIRGTIAAIEFDVIGGYLAESARAMHQRCIQQGVFLRPLGNVLYAMPPLRTSDESLQRIAGSMRDTVIHAKFPVERRA